MKRIIVISGIIIFSLVVIGSKLWPFYNHVDATKLALYSSHFKVIDENSGEALEVSVSYPYSNLGADNNSSPKSLYRLSDGSYFMSWVDLLGTDSSIEISLEGYQTEIIRSDKIDVIEGIMSSSSLDSPHIVKLKMVEQVGAPNPTPPSSQSDN